MTIQELKTGISKGMIVTFAGKEVNLFHKNGCYFSAVSGNYFEHEIEFSNDFAPEVNGKFVGEKELCCFDLDKSGLKLEYTGKISWKHIENKKR